MRVSILCRDSHLVQLLVDLLVVLVVLAQLGDQGPVGEREQLRVLQTNQTQMNHYYRTVQTTVAINNVVIWATCSSLFDFLCFEG